MAVNPKNAIEQLQNPTTWFYSL